MPLAFLFAVFGRSVTIEYQMLFSKFPSELRFELDTHSSFDSRVLQEDEKRCVLFFDVPPSFELSSSIGKKLCRTLPCY